MTDPTTRYLRGVAQLQTMVAAVEAKPKSRAARIKELMVDEGLTRLEAMAWADFEGDYRPENKDKT